MSYTVKQVNQEPIILFTLVDRVPDSDEAKRAYGEIAVLLGKLEERPFLITDYSGSAMTFSEMALALSSATKGEEGSPTDARIRQNLLVGTDELVEMAAHSLMQTQYGKVQTLVFADLEEALKYARAMLGSAKD